MKTKKGIYKITCLGNGKIRIGQAGDIEKRWSQYRTELKDNKCSIKDMQEDFNTFGMDGFRFEILEECPLYKHKERENYYILKFDAIKNGYNKILNDLSKKKKIRRGKEAKLYKEKRSRITSGENNGYNTKLSKKDVFMILDMLEDKVDRKIIAEEFDINPGYLSRIGKDRWIKEYLEWLENRKVASIGVDTTDSIYMHISSEHISM